MRRIFNWKVALLSIIILATFLRFYQLSNIPAGFLNDEANAGYDAYSVLQTGKDQWGNFLPVNNFIGFGDFPRPIHRYLLLIPISIFGLNEFSTRFISALSGVLSVIALYYLVRKLVNKKAALLSAFLLAIMPWAIGSSRIGHESNIAILFLIIALIFGLVQKSSKSLYYCVFFIALSMYTYSAYILYAPLALLIVLYVNYKKEKGYVYLVKPLILFFIIISPIIFQKNAATVRFSQIGLTTNITSIGLINNLNDQRGQCLIAFNPIICKVVDNKFLLFPGTFIKNYLSHFSPNFLYANGTSTQFSILPERGLDYLFNFLPLILGIAFLLKNNKQQKLGAALIILFLLSPVPDSLTSDGNYVRASIMQPFMALFSGLGIYYLLEILKNNKKIRYLSITLIILIISFGFISFFIIYLTYFKNNYAIYSQYGYKDLMTTVANKKSSYDRIYISSHFNDAKQYIYYLFYNRYSPNLYQTRKDVSYSLASDGWISIDRVENIYFISSILPVEQDVSISNKKILIISSPKDFPKLIKPQFTVKDKLGNVIFEAINLSDLLRYNLEHKQLISKENVETN